MEEDFPPRMCGTNGIPGEATAHPIELLSGAKRFTRSDFATADGALAIDRRFTSTSYGAVPANSIFSADLAFANWTLGYDFQLQFGENWDTEGSVVVLTPEGLALNFARNNTTGAVAPYVTYEQPIVNRDYDLAFVGTWPFTSPYDRELLLNATSTWKLTDPDGSVWTIQTFQDPDTGKYRVGRPTSVTRTSGSNLTFTYGTKGELATVTDQNGKVMTFTWATGSYYADSGALVTTPVAISSVALPDGSSISYTYESATTNPAVNLIVRLKKVEYKNASGAVLDSEAYGYDNVLFPTFVTRILDAAGVLRWKVTYDNQGRATRSEGPNGEHLASVAYSPKALAFSRTVTDALGRSTVYNYTRSSDYVFGAKLVSIEGQATAHCPSSAANMTYGPGNYLASATDEEGRQTTYIRNDRAQPTQIVEGAGTPSAVTRTITWHAAFNLPTKIVEPKLTTDYVYDTQGRLTSVTQTDTTTYTAPYATNGRTRTWTYGWSPTGQLLSVDGPLAGTGDTRSWTYNASGYLASATDEVGQVTTVTSRDWRGAPLTIVDANGVSTAMTYDIRGRVLTATVNPGASQSQYQFAYNAVGDVTKITLPRGGYLQYTYDDARRLTLVTNDRGETVTLTPNAVGEPTSSVIKTGSTITAQQTMVYDELGRLIQSIGAGAQTTNLGYDKVSNPTSLTDARGKLFTTAFDPLDRVITQTDPETHSVRYAYDAADQLTSHKDGRQLETTMIVDGFGQVIQEISPDRGVRKYWYDAAGRMTKLVDGDNEETNFTHDNAGRRTAMTFLGAVWESVTYAYDSVAGGNKGKGRLTSVTEESGSSAFTYDEQGRTILDAKVIQGVGYNVGYAYDANGKVTQITLPSGRIIAYARAIDGSVTAVTTKPSATGTVQNIATGVAYQPFGPLKSLTYGNGLALTRTHDQNYWLTGTKVSATGATRLDLTFDRNANGQLAGITDNAATGRSAAFGYYDAGRLQYGVGPWGNHSYVYDAAGNRTDFRTETGGAASYQFAVNSGTSNQATQVQDTNGAPLRNLIYRDGGDLYEDAHVGGVTHQYYYNARKRLVVVNKDGADAAYYGYDFRNQRVWRQVMTPTYSSTHYIFDQQGHLLAEHNGDTGAVIKQYIWLDDMPLAVIDKSSGTEVAYYIHTGQIGEPLVMTNASKAKVWDAYVEPFGKAQVFGTASASIDLRLPGQWAQMESGLSQNWNRDYDPTLARYIQADPIGLDGGQNLYAYVDGRPTEWIDPDGRIWTGLAGAGIGAIGGGAGNYLYQMHTNGWDNSKVDWGDVGISAGTGAIGGFLLTSGLGTSLTGVIGIGAATNVLNYALTEDCYTPQGFAWAAISGGLAGAIGGRAPNPYTFIKPSPFRQDFDLITKMTSAHNFGLNAAGAYLGSTTPPQVVSGP